MLACRGAVPAWTDHGRQPPSGPRGGVCRPSARPPAEWDADRSALATRHRPARPGRPEEAGEGMRAHREREQAQGTLGTADHDTRGSVGRSKPGSCALQHPGLLRVPWGQRPCRRTLPDRPRCSRRGPRRAGLNPGTRRGRAAAPRRRYRAGVMNAGARRRRRQPQADPEEARAHRDGPTTAAGSTRRSPSRRARGGRARHRVRPRGLQLRRGEPARLHRRRDGARRDRLAGSCRSTRARRR